MLLFFRSLGPQNHFWPLLIAAAYPLSAAALETLISVTNHLNLLQPIDQISMGTIPAETLQNGYTNRFYHHDATTDAVTLNTGSAYPREKNEDEPGTVLQEESFWNPTESGHALNARMRIDHFPKSGPLIIGRLLGRQGSVAILQTDGNNVIAVVRSAQGTQHVTVGSAMPDQGLHTA